MEARVHSAHTHFVGFVTSLLNYFLEVLHAWNWKALSEGSNYDIFFVCLFFNVVV